MTIPKYIFIIPYRDRLPLKLHFEIYMNYILQDYDENSYKIYFIHQCDNRPFNRGAMKNIGFLAMKNLYPDNYKDIIFIFNDIDTIPSKKNLLNFDTPYNTIKHYYGFKFALGGIFSIRGNDFEKIKGFPNLWGWGLEDNTLKMRADINNIKIDYSNFYHYNNINILHFNNNEKKLLAKQEIWKYKKNDMDDIRYIYNISYDIEDNMVNVTNFSSKIPFNNNNYVNETLKNSQIKLDKNFIPPEYKSKFQTLKFI